MIYYRRYSKNSAASPPRSTNKRVGAVAAIVFLALNGYEFDAPEEDFADMVLAVAQGELDKAEVAVAIRNWTARR